MPWSVFTCGVSERRPCVFYEHEISRMIGISRKCTAQRTACSWRVVCYGYEEALRPVTTRSPDNSPRARTSSDMSIMLYHEVFILVHAQCIVSPELKILTENGSRAKMCQGNVKVKATFT